MLLVPLVAAMVLACAGAGQAQDTASAPAPQGVGKEEGVRDRYIVVFKDDAVRIPDQVAADQAQRLGLEISQTYRYALKGYAARIPAARLDEVRADPRVDYVEPDEIVGAVEQALPWGIDRIDADTSTTRAGNGSGSVPGVNAYVIDTGIDKNHPDLNVVDHVNFTGGKNRDCNGHGTHVAGTAAAKDNARAVVGVAPGAPLTGVKVLGCRGSGLTSNVIKGVDWVTGNAKKPAIANMSLGGGTSDALDTAVKRSADSGIFYAVAAGNEGEDACANSPARAGAGTNNGIMTTAATDRSDAEATFSNYGSCVDVWAPGVSILSTKLGGGTVPYSGTSMASPHTGGTGALYLSMNPVATPAEVEGRLKTDAKATGTKSKDGTQIERVYAGGY